MIDHRQTGLALIAVAVAVAVATAAALLWYNFSKPASVEGELFALIGAIEANEPIKAKSDLTILPCSQEYASGANACFSKKVRMRLLQIDEVKFSAQELGSIIQLNGIGPDCITLDAVKQAFPDGEVGNGCYDAVCRYYGLRRPWGRLAFRIPDDLQDRQCVQNVVFNTDYYR